MKARVRTGFASASTALDRAARLSEHADGRTRRVYLAADAAGLAGQGERALGLLDDAGGPNEGGSLRDAIEPLRGRIELLQGRTDAAQAILTAAANRIEMQDPTRAATMLAEAAFAAMIRGDGVAALAIARHAQSLQSVDGELASVITGLSWAPPSFRSDRLRGGLELVVGAAEIAEGITKEDVEPEYVIHAAHVLSWVGEYRRARQLLDRTLREIRKAGALGVLPWALYASADLHIRTGYWSAARADAS